MDGDIFIWDSATLGKALKEQRRSLGLKQADVAGDLGFSPRLLSEIENGRDTVAYGKILRYADYLAMDFVIRKRGDK